MTVGAGVGVGDRLEVHHVLPEIGRLDARQELLRRVVHARIALMRRRGGTRGGRSENAEGDDEAEQDEPRLRRSRTRTKWHGKPPRSWTPDGGTMDDPFSQLKCELVITVEHNCDSAADAAVDRRK